MEDWVYPMKANDFSTLMIAIVETEDYIERSMIVEKLLIVRSRSRQRAWKQSSDGEKALSLRSKMSLLLNAISP